MKKRTPLRRQIARLLFYVGAAAIIAAAVITAAGFALAPGYWLGAGLIALGLNALLGGDLIVGGEPRTFTARGQAVRGRLRVRAGLCDLGVGECPNDRIAMLRYGPMGKPSFQAKNGLARIELKQPRLLPNITTWQAGLASNMLWDLDVVSSLGDLTLDLSSLRLENVRARTRSGRLVVRCPERGAVNMALQTGMGEVELHIPERTAVRITVEYGELVNVSVKNERLRPLGVNGYVTPDYEGADTQVEILIESVTGDVLLV